MNSAQQADLIVRNIDWLITVDPAGDGSACLPTPDLFSRDALTPTPD